MIPTELQQLHVLHWNTFAQNYNLTNAEGCGKYTEHWVEFANNNGYSKVKNLRKNPGQTQYNGHAVDAFLYTDGTGNPEGKYSAVDIIGGAEGPNPVINWGVDIPRYTDADIWTGNSQPSSTVPWVAYDEQGFEKLKQQLAYDYGRRPQNADFDVTVWAARVFHSTYMGPNKTPLGFDAAMQKHRPEWCAALGVPVDNTWF